MWWKNGPDANKRVKVGLSCLSSSSCSPPPTKWSPDLIVEKKSDLTNLYQFQGDCGLVGPITKPGFKAYQLCNLETKTLLLDHLGKEWKELTDTFIRAKWSGGSNIFYILCDDGGSLIGCVSVDRNNFYPIISNLFVVPGKRGNGYGRLLLDYAKTFTVSLGFTQFRLWCKPQLLPWYEGMGWKQENNKIVGDDTIYFMICDGGNKNI